MLCWWCVSICWTSIAFVLWGYNAAFLHNWWCIYSLLICKYEPFWKELSLYSLILRWPTRPKDISLLSLGNISFFIDAGHCSIRILKMRTNNLYIIFTIFCIPTFTVPKKPNMRICQQKLGRLTRYVFIGILVSHERRPFHYLNMLSTSFTGREQRVREKRRVCSRRRGWHYCPFQNVMMWWFLL